MARPPLGFRMAAHPCVDLQAIIGGLPIGCNVEPRVEGNLISKEGSPTASFNPVPTLLGPNLSTVHFYS